MFAYFGSVFIVDSNHAYPLCVKDCKIGLEYIFFHNFYFYIFFFFENVLSVQNLVTPCSRLSIVNFEQVIAGWIEDRNLKKLK